MIEINPALVVLTSALTLALKTLLLGRPLTTAAVAEEIMLQGLAGYLAKLLLMYTSSVENRQ